MNIGKLCVLMLLLMCPICLLAQQKGKGKKQKTASAVSSSQVLLNVRGIIYESESLQPMQGAAVKLLTEKDSLLTGVYTPENGEFLLPDIKPGNYKLQVSFMGFKDQTFALKLPRKSGNFRVDDVLMREAATLMREAVVDGQLAEMKVEEDTVVYNADAFKLQDGALMEELIEKLPGVLKDDNGKYTWNGKDITEILVDGKEFFGGNMDFTLKNLPAEIVDKVKAYDRQSDRARLTGIDDGEERLVLDFSIKKNRKKGWFGDAEAGYGTEDRYMGRTTLNRFVDKQKFTIVGNANNTRGNGLTDRQHGGFTMNWENEKVEVDGSVNANFNQSESAQSSSRQSFENKNAAYSNSINGSEGDGRNFSMNYKVEWEPDTMTKVHIRPRFSYSSSSSGGYGESAAFRLDPYSHKGITDPLAQLMELPKRYRVNHRQNANHGTSDNLNGSLSLRFNRKLAKEGRNVSLEVDGGMGNTDAERQNFSQTDYYRILAASGEDSVYHKTQYNDSENRNRNISAGITYIEPVGRQIYLQMSYQYNYRYSDMNRTVSSIFDPYNAQYGVNIDNFRNFESYAKRDEAQCNYTTNKYQNHNMQLQLRLNRTKYRLTVGGNLRPQINMVDYNKGGKHYDVRRSVVNASPMLNFRYRFSKQEQIDLRYNGNTGQPSITDLIPDTLSNANPLNIRLGNPELKPSFTQSFQGNYRKSIIRLQRTYAASVQFRTTQNSVSSCTEYDEETGGRVTRPENINGNWSGNAGFNFNTAFAGDQRFRINTNTTANMVNSVSYVYRQKKKETIKNRTRRTGIRQGLRLTFRNDWLEVNAHGSFAYNHSRSTNTSASNLDTWRINYGASTVIRFPWNMTFQTSITEQSRHGYSDASMNTDELLWGFQLSRRFLPQKNLMLSLRAVDVLNEREEISRVITATARTDTRTQSVNSYFLLSLNYRFGKFGGKKKKQKDLEIENNGPSLNRQIESVSPDIEGEL